MRVEGLILKIDFEKAYDNVNWNFLLVMLRKFGGGAKWCRWIRGCITTPSYSILINGSPSEEIFPEKGLRQGDPLSPFHFNIVVEVLNILMERAIEDAMLKGVQVGVNGLRVSHLQFAADTIFFCNNDINEILQLKRILWWFQQMSGLKINFSKSMLCGVRVPEIVVSNLASFLGCVSGKLLMKYLGLPLGANPRRISTWQPVIDNMEKKLKM